MFVVPAPLDETDRSRRSEDAAVAHVRRARLLGASRAVDFFLHRGGGGPVLNEVNTMPGFTEAVAGAEDVRRRRASPTPRSWTCLVQDCSRDGRSASRWSGWTHCAHERAGRQRGRQGARLDARRRGRGRRTRLRLWRGDARLSGGTGSTRTDGLVGRRPSRAATSAVVRRAAGAGRSAWCGRSASWQLVERDADDVRLSSPWSSWLSGRRAGGRRRPLVASGLSIPAGTVHRGLFTLSVLVDGGGRLAAYAPSHVSSRPSTRRGDHLGGGSRRRRSSPWRWSCPWLAGLACALRGAQPATSRASAG